MSPALDAPFYYSLGADGLVAQLGERRNGIAEVDGSIPFESTSSSREKLFYFDLPKKLMNLVVDSPCIRFQTIHAHYWTVRYMNVPLVPVYSLTG